MRGSDSAWVARRAVCNQARVDGAISIRLEIAGQDRDAVAAVGSDGTRIGLVVDHQGNLIALRELACDATGDGGVCDLSFCEAEDVVASDRVHCQGGVAGGRTGRVNGVSMCSAHGASIAKAVVRHQVGGNGFTTVRDQIAGGDIFGERAV